uniref:TNF receptor-associated factor n=1 Tax=Amazona collaria TaxID=241587 RepID=A0A8B9FKF6_9PSIT
TSQAAVETSGSILVPFPKIFNHTALQKYLCSNCNNILKKALQTLCGHRYCSACLAWISFHCLEVLPARDCRVFSTSFFPVWKCGEGWISDLADVSFSAFGDAAINKEISELRVHCVTLGCSWSGIMKDFEVCLKAVLGLYPSLEETQSKDLGWQNGDSLKVNAYLQFTFWFMTFYFQEHQSLCEYALIPCHTGCGHMVMRKKLADHLENGCVNNVTTCQRSANGFIPQTEPSVNGTGKSIPDLQILAGLEIRGDLEEDCFPESSIAEEESALQQLVREKVISELENKLQVFENIVAVLNKEVEISSLEIMAFRRQSELDQNIIRGLELKVNKLHRCLTQKDAGLSSLHKSLLFSEQASYDGVFLWKITDVGRKLQDSVTGRTVSLYSPAFYTAKYGYKVCLRVYLNGDGTGKGTHMSLFFVVMKGDYDALLPWPFRNKVTFMLLDQNNREHVIDAFRPDLASASFQRPVNDMNIASGCPMFLPLFKLQSPKYAYVKEDTLFLKCIVETNY